VLLGDADALLGRLEASQVLIADDLAAFGVELQREGLHTGRKCTGEARGREVAMVTDAGVADVMRMGAMEVRLGGGTRGGGAALALTHPAGLGGAVREQTVLGEGCSSGGRARSSSSAGGKRVASRGSERGDQKIGAGAPRDCMAHEAVGAGGRRGRIDELQRMTRHADDEGLRRSEAGRTAVVVRVVVGSVGANSGGSSSRGGSCGEGRGGSEGGEGSRGGERATTLAEHWVGEAPARLAATRQARASSSAAGGGGAATGAAAQRQEVAAADATAASGYVLTSALSDGEDATLRGGSGAARESSRSDLEVGKRELNALAGFGGSAIGGGETGETRPLSSALGLGDGGAGSGEGVGSSSASGSSGGSGEELAGGARSEIDLSLLLLPLLLLTGVQWAVFHLFFLLTAAVFGEGKQSVAGRGSASSGATSGSRALMTRQPASLSFGVGRPIPALGVRLGSGWTGQQPLAGRTLSALHEQPGLLGFDAARLLLIRLLLSLALLAGGDVRGGRLAARHGGGKRATVGTGSGRMQTRCAGDGGENSH
jgi:hypothetical protein